MNSPQPNRPQAAWPSAAPHRRFASGPDSACRLCRAAEKQGLAHAPHAWTLRHVFVPLPGEPGRCYCGWLESASLHLRGVAS